MRHHDFDVSKLISLVEEIQARIATGKRPDDWISIDEKISQRLFDNPLHAAIYIIHLGAIRRSISALEMQYASEGNWQKITNGFAMEFPMMEAMQIGYNLALRELGLDDTKNMSNGTRPMQA